MYPCSVWSLLQDLQEYACGMVQWRHIGACLLHVEWLDGEGCVAYTDNVSQDSERCKREVCGMVHQWEACTKAVGSIRGMRGPTK